MDKLMETLKAAGEWVLSHLLAVAALVVVIVVGLSLWVWTNNIHNDGFTRQRQVFQEYNTYQTTLSTCLDNSRIGTQIASAEYSQFKDAMTAIVAARYQTPDGKATTAANVLGGGALISALQEQYPNVDRSLWKEALSTALGCRNQVAGEMTKLQSIAGNFDTWSNTGGIFARHFRNNWPNDQLKVIGLNGVLTGREALDFLTQPILTTDATNAVRTHVMPDQDLFPSSNPSPTP